MTKWTIPADLAAAQAEADALRARVAELEAKNAQMRAALVYVVNEAPSAEPPPAYDDWGDMIADTAERHAEREVDIALWNVAQFARAALAASREDKG